jgi:guanine deaminase
VEERDIELMRRAIELARIGANGAAGGPFGSVVARDGVIIGEGSNLVTVNNDPTAHAEVVAIRNACATIGSFQLAGCVIYTSCEPCPMCLGAIYWARPERMVIACTREDAAAAGFDDAMIYDEIARPLSERTVAAEQLLRDEGLDVFRQWLANPNKIEY